MLTTLFLPDTYLRPLPKIWNTCWALSTTQCYSEPTGSWLDKLRNVPCRESRRRCWLCTPLQNRSLPKQQLRVPPTWLTSTHRPLDEGVPARDWAWDRKFWISRVWAAMHGRGSVFDLSQKVNLLRRHTHNQARKPTGPVCSEVGQQVLIERWVLL